MRMKELMEDHLQKSGKEEYFLVEYLKGQVVHLIWTGPLKHIVDDKAGMFSFNAKDCHRYQSSKAVHYEQLSQKSRYITSTCESELTMALNSSNICYRVEQPFRKPNWKTEIELDTKSMIFLYTIFSKTFETVYNK